MGYYTTQLDDVDRLIARARRAINVMDDERVLVETLAETGVSTGDAWLALHAALILENDARRAYGEPEVKLIV